MGAVKDVAPYALLAGGIILAYVYRDKIAAWIRGLIPSPGTMAEDTLNLAPGSITGQDGQSLDVLCKQKYGTNFLWNPWTGKCVNGWTGSPGVDTSQPGTTPGQITDAVNPSGNPVQTLTVTQDNMCEFEPWKSSDLCAPVASLTHSTLQTAAPEGISQAELDNRYINAIVAKQGVSYQVAEAYYRNTYGMSFHDWNTKVFQSPEFAAKVGIPELTYTEVYARAAANQPGGIYHGYNLNPYVPQNDPDYTTIYNPSSGAMWSGSQASTSYLMGDSPEAAAWRARYL